MGRGGSGRPQVEVAPFEAGAVALQQRLLFRVRTGRVRVGAWHSTGLVTSVSC